MTLTMTHLTNQLQIIKNTIFRIKVLVVYLQFSGSSAADTHLISSSHLLFQFFCKLTNIFFISWRNTTSPVLSLLAKFIRRATACRAINPFVGNVIIKRFATLFTLEGFNSIPSIKRAVLSAKSNFIVNVPTFERTIFSLIGWFGLKLNVTDTANIFHRTNYNILERKGQCYA